MSDEILSRSVTDPRGEKLLDEMRAQDLSSLSLDDLKQRIKSLKSEIERVEGELGKRDGVTAAAEALFKS